MTEDTTRQDQNAPADQAAAPTEPEAAAAEEAEHEESTVREEVEAEMGELREQLEALNDRHLRLAAEFDNYRKRNERERQLLEVRLQLDLVAGLLDVVDDLQRVEETSSGMTVEALAEGVRLVEKKFLSVLESAGLERVEAEDRPFDPEVMEALMMVPTEDASEDGHVADVFQQGYRFRDVLVRPARVRVYQYEGPVEESE